MVLPPHLPLFEFGGLVVAVVLVVVQLVSGAYVPTSRLHQHLKVRVHLKIQQLYIVRYFWSFNSYFVHFCPDSRV